MVYLLIAATLGRLRPDLALRRLGVGILLVQKSVRRGGGGGSRNKANSKIQFRHPRRLRGRARPSDMSGSRGGVCPSFCNGYFAHSVDTTSVGVGLDSRWSVSEALKNVKGKSRARGRLKPVNRFWRFRCGFAHLVGI